MKRTILLPLGLVLLAAVIFGSVKVFDYYERDAARPTKSGRTNPSRTGAGGEDTFPLTTTASKDRFVALYCLYVARSKDQLRRCSHRPPRAVYRSKDDEFAWLFASEVIDYCEGGGPAGRFCDSADVNGPIDRIARLIRR